MNKRKGFTLIELMMVIVIVGILASITVPMVMGHRKKAVLSEAVIVLGILRRAQRAYFMEHGEYYSGAAVDMPGIKSGDLSGTYFHEDCYHVNATASRADPDGTFMVRCVIAPGPNHKAPQYEFVASLLGEGTLIMFMDGTIKAETMGDDPLNWGYENY